MHMWHALLSVASAAGALAFPTTEKRSFAETSVWESIGTAPEGWARDDTTALSKDEIIELRIQLSHQDMDKFHDLALNIATPSHELYGKHVSQDAIDAIIAPAAESKDSVLDWLSQSGLGNIAVPSARGNAVVVKASIRQAEQLLGAEYAVYSNAELNTKAVRTLQYSLPTELRGHVSFIQPTTFFGLRSTISEVSLDPLENDSLQVEAVAGCSGGVTPQCIANLYNLTKTLTTAQSNGKLGIGGFLEQWPSLADLSTFLNKYAISGNTDTLYSCDIINNGSCPANPSSSDIGVEANLDVQYARAVAKDIPIVYYSTGGRPPWLGTGENTNEPYLEFLEYLLALPDADLPQTLSISYGDSESTVPLSYADTTCDLFAQLGARGVSVTVSSGDSSVGSTCKVNGKTQFTTAFPAACPWITSVGGTQSNAPEAAWTSGGAGFSEVFGQPSYQAAAVKAWIASNTDNVAQYYNASGRAYPDVSAQASGFRIIVDGADVGVSGTSCSSPTFAGIIQLLNSERLAAGKPPLGFLNPWLYSGAGANGFNDIVNGKTTGCRSTVSGGLGFSARAGWDPATGWGTPNYDKLLAISNST